MRGFQDPPPLEFPPNSMPAPDDFRAQLEALRPYLLRYASLQLRDAAAAEDAVQEALLAALAGQASFAGRANLRTWLTGILKHKIVDAIRRQAREPVVPAGADEEPGEIDELFSQRGHWNERPAFGERVALRVHFAICLGCRRAKRQMKFLRRAVRELAART
jgi:RNA polymerase sigma factor (sigma-70 family)